MLSSIERHNEILRLASKTGKVSVDELAHLYSVSTVTIRNDLNSLDNKGLLVRSRGGAILPTGFIKELSIGQKQTKNQAIKQQLATEAAKLIFDGDAIILDSGTTTEEIALQLCKHKQLKVLTNGLNVAAKLAQIVDIEIMVTGGTLRQKSLSFFDDKAESSLQHCHFDKVILGVDGFDLAAGITTHFAQEASLNRLMCEKSSQIIVVTDSSKFGKRSCYIVQAYNKVSTVITDKGIPAEYKKAFTLAGIQLIIVDE
ncbi:MULTISPECIES: transcriptional repressor AgaR [Colwelliaceae]|uniref:Transcriptional regulator, DeoR family n=1 Tax=Colwellia psychrerythraea TaxID=28229 RepID=A0A099KCD4_COLPS|nr:MULTISPECIES: transcriptional repressor AgaR [Colwelliaceae]KGJ88399.1 transcriptional regulator, DeoR family [Colwellia psychrerythraea]KGJ88683.1 putative transcriptional regulator [Thalassotalea sp. ND16A]